ncbi:MAG TPA: NACHT domain-containing protein [Roseiflexaceae bacterium]|nr:NACHT domain-containing protein [Roseiflexaceae bacterium]
MSGMLWLSLADGVPLPETPRGLMIAKVRAMWIAGVLERSLYRAVQLAPGLRSDPRRVDLPMRALVQEAGGQAEDLPEGTRIVDVYDRFGGALLILGAPGAGKTTLLLELARELLDRAEADATLPIPVVFPLSTWAADRKPLEQWLIDQLKVLYQVSKKQATAWVEQHQILPLLDGLDEVAEAHRPACVRAINAFREERGTLPLIVCSRLREYETVAQETAQLRLHGAMIVQTLRQTVVLEALAGLGPEVQTLRDTLAADERDWLWKVATSPLGLSVLIPAVQHSPALLQAGGNDDERRDRIFGAYVDAMFARRAASGQWSREETIRLLSWLAAQMQAQGQTVLVLWGLHRGWLPQIWQRWVVRLGIALFYALVGLVVLGLMAWLAGGLVGVLVSSLVGGLAGCAIGAMVGWQLSGRIRQVITERNIPPKGGFTGEQLGGVLSGFMGELAGGTFGALCGGFSGAVVGGQLGGPGGGFAGAVAGALTGALTGALVGALVVRRNVSSYKDYPFVGTVLVVALGTWVIEAPLVRLLLAHAGLAPLRYAAFLDHAADRVLLRRVGGGWVFVHRLLLDYFAGLAPGLGVPLPAPVQEETRAEGEAAS